MADVPMEQAGPREVDLVTGGGQAPSPGGSGGDLEPSSDEDMATARLPLKARARACKQALREIAQHCGDGDKSPEPTWEIIEQRAPAAQHSTGPAAVNRDGS